jgi:hypothetical protein
VSSTQTCPKGHRTTNPAGKPDIPTSPRRYRVPAIGTEGGNQRIGPGYQRMSVSLVSHANAPACLGVSLLCRCRRSATEMNISPVVAALDVETPQPLRGTRGAKSASCGGWVWAGWRTKARAGLRCGGQRRGSQAGVGFAGFTSSLGCVAVAAGGARRAVCGQRRPCAARLPRVRLAFR